MSLGVSPGVIYDKGDDGRRAVGIPDASDVGLVSLRVQSHLGDSARGAR